MPNNFNIAQFATTSLSEKYHFFDKEVVAFVENSNDKEILQVLKSIITDINENPDIRKKAVECLTNCTFLKRIKTRQTITILIDDWNNSNINTKTIFLEVQRLKDLFYFYSPNSEDTEEIENVYLESTNSRFSDISSEAFLKLGLIYFQKSLLGNQKDRLEYLLKSNSFFTKGHLQTENQIDTLIYKQIVEITINLFNRNLQTVDLTLDHLSQDLLKKELFSIKHGKQYHAKNYYISLYNSLNSLIKILKEDPNLWLNVREKLSELHNEYSLIENEKLKSRLDESVLTSIFARTLEKNFIEPYLATQFHSQLQRLDTRLKELASDSKEYEFIEKVKELASNITDKKKTLVMI
ncbi:hypothetical protein [Xanthocytophaga agilis]|uniref:Uncharacterized protein n=1 Tax=Xanthocytophaga agilis TaxID=3048010 RepID=A0AAE3R8Q4_9BACT|nr:hypothetical protein [Xanthocytophaga agilis]MDJ1503500.1 hypothetical protein [Xanthocytophaga agilis]